MAVPVTHIAYSDETHHNIGRFRGIAVITAPIEAAARAAIDVREILNRSEIRELKWEKLRTARERFAALHVADWLLDRLNLLRADVLTWDTEDSRHRIRGRDDIANLHRMYHHLFRNVLRSRWPNDAAWQLCPDEMNAIDWAQVHEILDRVSMRTETRHTLGTAGKFILALKRDYRIVQIVPSHSHEQPLIQVADLLAGMSAFSRLHFDQFRHWQYDAAGQSNFFRDSGVACSRGEQEKFTVLSDFYRRCRSRKLPISLDKSRGLLTHKPSTPVNFWHYVPQRMHDKAPIKKLEPGRRVAP